MKKNAIKKSHICYFFLKYNATQVSNLIPTVIAINNPYSELRMGKVGSYIAQRILSNKSQFLRSFSTINLTLSHQTRNIHAFTTRSTLIHAPNHLISNESRKDVSLVIELIESVFPKHVEYGWTYKESADSHPKTICKSRECKSDNENWKDGGDEDDKGFCCE